ncbi:protein TsetseEP-like [Strongylocentrotus purpuratus]|uniref:Mitochondrial import receptor subunit TOM22 homolog n=1 Tax=Strongylocentrotus purpuratus TaxID=7668 RepID=A0A7M7PUI7_STRPU|nr:protein TsetseEP-like [Strongylocentrotus purpuratus]
MRRYPKRLSRQKSLKNNHPKLKKKHEESLAALTDSILDDDLVVIPSQTEVQQQESAAAEQLDTEQPDTVVPSEPSPPAEPEPQAAIPESEPSQPAPESELKLEPQPESEPQSKPQPQPELQPEPAPAPAPQHKPQSEPTQSQSQSVDSVPPAPPQPNPEPSIKPARPASATVRTASKAIKGPMDMAVVEEDDDDIEDETLTERLVGLTEMFPQTLCTVAGVTFSLSVSSMKKLFNFSRSALWIGSTSFMLLILPIIFETEMVHMEQAQIQRQKQILLGPNAASAGGMTGGLTPPIPGVSVAAPPPGAR